MGLENSQVTDLAQESILGRRRLVVASLAIEGIIQDRETFLTSIADNVDSELNKVGLEFLNIKITGVTDASGYIKAIGRKVAAQTIVMDETDVMQAQLMAHLGVEAAHKLQAIAL